MSDEYVQRYQQVSHEELYNGVKAGDAEQIETLASKWSSLKTTLDGLGKSLRDDLDALERTWAGAAGQEFQRRLDLVVQYSNSLASGMGGVHEGLTLMAGPLRAAQQQAESPDETDDHDQALNGAVKGAVFGPAGVLVGGFIGHQQDKEEQEKAHQRMVKVVAQLAAMYDTFAYDSWVPPVIADPDTPHTLNQTSSTSQSGPGATTPTRAPDSGPLAHTGTARTIAPQPPAHGRTPPARSSDGPTSRATDAAADPPTKTARPPIARTSATPRPTPAPARHWPGLVCWPDGPRGLAGWSRPPRAAPGLPARCRPVPGQSMTPIERRCRHRCAGRLDQSELRHDSPPRW